MMLGSDEVHVWHLGADERTADALPSERMLALLSADERGRHARFLFERDRDRYLLAHAALRLILARYTGVGAASLRFERNRHGRPELAPAGSHGALRFNLSHTGGAIALAVCRGFDVGVDVERHAAHRDLPGIAQRFFAPAEVRALSSLPPDVGARRFFRYWTLKESYIKARGLGLALPLDKFWFDAGGETSAEELSRPSIAIDPSLGDAPATWRFVLRGVTPEHTLAAAVRCGGREVAFVLRETCLADWWDGQERMG